jgi:hypothetical protein
VATSDHEPLLVEEPVREDLKGTAYELFMLALSVLSIVNLVLQAALFYGSQKWWLITYIDAGLGELQQAR